MKPLLIIAVLLLTVIIAIGWTTPQPTTWEYKFEYDVREKKANELGAQGWELVSVSLTSGSSSVNEYAFKRRK